MSALKRVFLSTFGDRLLGRARVAEVLEVSPSFRFIDLEADAFRELEIPAGAKIQIDAGGWNFRTYTPVSQIRELGRVGLLAFASGRGPGSDWVLNARPGDALRFCGPRPSLRMPESERPIVLYGDETTLALAANLQRKHRKEIAKIILEASNPEEIGKIVEDMGLERVEVFRKESMDSLPKEAERLILENARQPNRLLLTGRSQSVRRLKELLRQEGIPLSRVSTQSHWASITRSDSVSSEVGAL